MMGFGIKFNFFSDRQYLEEAAAQGDSDALNSLGGLFFLEKYYKESLACFKQAATQSQHPHAKANYNYLQNALLIAKQRLKMGVPESLVANSLQIDVSYMYELINKIDL